MELNASKISRTDNSHKTLTKVCLAVLFGCALLTGILPQVVIAGIAVLACMLLTLTPNMFLAFPIMVFYYECFGNFMGMSVYRYFSLLFLLAVIFRLKKFDVYPLQIISAVSIILYCIVVVAPDNLRRAVFVIVDLACMLVLANQFLSDRDKTKRFFTVYAMIALCTFVTGLLVDRTMVTNDYSSGETVEIIRSNATFEDPNYAGFFLTIAVFAVIALKLFTPKIRWAVVVGLYVIILSTISITAILANTVLWVIYFMVTRRLSVKSVIAIALIFVVVFGLYSYGVKNPDTPVLGTLSYRISEKLDALEEGDMSEVTTNRTDVSRRHWEYFKEQSFFKKLVGYNAASTLKSNSGGLTGVAHNEYIDLFLNIGILGAFFMLWYVLKRTLGTLKEYFKTDDRHNLTVFMVKCVWILYGFTLTMFGDYRFMLALFM